MNALRIAKVVLLAVLFGGASGCFQALDCIDDQTAGLSERDTHEFPSDPDRTWEVTREVLAEQGFRCPGPPPLEQRVRCDGPVGALERQAAYVAIWTLGGGRHSLEILEFWEDADRTDSHLVHVHCTSPKFVAHRVWDVVARVDPTRADEARKAAAASRERAKRPRRWCDDAPADVVCGGGS